MSIDTEYIRERLDCREVAERYQVRFRNRSSNWWLAHCFNSENHAHGDRNPSLSIGPKGYKCFSANCGISGDVFGLIAYFEGLDGKQDFDQVVAIAAEMAGLDPEAMRRDFIDSLPKRPGGYGQSRRGGSSERGGANTSGGGGYNQSKPRRGGQAGAPQVSQYDSSGKRKSWHHYQRDLKRAQRKQAIDSLLGRKPKNQRQPPKLVELFPDPYHQEFEIDPRHVRLDLMKAIWELVGPLELTQEATKWLKSRGIDPAVAHAYGCRDWTARREEILTLFKEFSPQDLIASGLKREQDDKLKKWCGLRALDGDGWAQGLAVPVVHPGWPMAPIAWRWRLYNPFKTKSGQSFKALAQYGGEPSVPAIPLGVAPPSAYTLKEIAQWPLLAQDPMNPEYVIVVCEGEPDWLSIADVSSKLETGVYIVPIGLVVMSHGYPLDYIGLLEDAKRVVCMMDEGRTVKKWNKPGGAVVVDKIKAQMLYMMQQKGKSFEHAFSWVNETLVSALQPDDQDVNDLHKDKKLEPLIEELLGDVL